MPDLERVEETQESAAHGGACLSTTLGVEEHQQRAAAARQLLPINPVLRPRRHNRAPPPPRPPHLHAHAAFVSSDCRLSLCTATLRLPYALQDMSQDLTARCRTVHNFCTADVVF